MAPHDLDTPGLRNPPIDLDTMLDLTARAEVGGVKIAPKRVTGFGAAVSAGTMASSSGIPARMPSKTGTGNFFEDFRIGQVIE